ncbi:uncharacterized protein LOC132181799 [Corylus avellana]|uniref:uncharacterized protein LOC132181799 n=1 Tax=Corylus avellana TaxID=13451 RepID=UPI00286C2522|nr:uncharacterized protein LOC132181799 [Corylus avellana]
MASNMVQIQVPQLKKENYEKWCFQFKALFGSQDLCEFVSTGFAEPTPEQEATYTADQKVTLKDQRKKDKKALYLLYQGFNDSTFEKAAEAAMSKAAWDTLNTIFKDLETISAEELLGSLRVHEQCILKNASATSLEQALESKLNCDKPKGGRGQWNLRRSGANYHGRGRGRGRGNTNGRGPSQERRYFPDQRKQNVQCYNCGKCEHYASECSYKNDGHVNLDEASSSENKNSTLLLAHNDSSGQHDVWYLDSSASNHMCGRKETLVKLKEGVCGNMSLGDSSKLVVEGRGKVRIFQKNGKEEFISDVYYVPSMKGNILSIGQIL